MITPPIATGGRAVNPAMAELAEIPRWVCWKPEQRGDTITKVPYTIGGRRKAKSTDPRTWDTFDACWTSAFVDGAAAGIGIVVDGSDELMGADLDKCIFESGVVAPWARVVVRMLASYTERSPSGRGLRVFFRSAKGQDWGLNEKGQPKGGRVVKFQGGKVEIYRHERFFTATGNHFEESPLTINHVAPKIIAELLAEAPREREQNGPDPQPAKEIPDGLRPRSCHSSSTAARARERCGRKQEWSDVAGGSRCRKSAI